MFMSLTLKEKSYKFETGYIHQLLMPTTIKDDRNKHCW